MKTLKLVLTHHWYDMIESGEKKEEYREITPYWVRKITAFTDKEGIPINVAVDRLNKGSDKFLEDLYSSSFPNYSYPKNYTHVQFQRAYPKNPPRMTKELVKIRIGTGNPEWGAEPGKLYFVIELK
jgi:hypothetical protein